MRRLLLLALLLLLSNFAQAQTTGPGFIIYVGSAPSGACSAGAYQENVIGLGTVYTCQSGTWTQISGGGGGGGTVTSVSGLSPLFAVANPTTTPTFSLSTFAAHKFYGNNTGSTATPGAQSVTEDDVTNLTSDLALKAPLASPTFTGTPAAPTATVGTNTTQLATTAFVLANAGSAGSAVASPVTLCTSGSSFTCASAFNIIANQRIVAFCGYFTNGAGAGVPSMSDTLSLTWTQITTAFQSGQSRGVTAWIANPGATTGADTFTCGNSVSISSGGFAAVMVPGSTAVDVSNTVTGSAVVENLTLTTTTANEPIFVLEEYGGTGTTLNANFFNILSSTGQAVVVNLIPSGSIGTYYLSTNFSANHAMLAVAIK